MGETVTLHLPVVPVVGQLLGLLVLPVLAGMALRHRAPGFVARHAVTARRVAAAGVLLVLGAVVVAQRAVLMTVAADGAAAALAFTTLAVAAGTAVGRVGRLPREDRFVLVAEFGVRNTALAMLLATQVLGRGDLLAAVVLFFVVQTLVLLAVTAAYGSVGRAASASTT